MKILMTIILTFLSTLSVSYAKYGQHLGKGVIINIKSEELKTTKLDEGSQTTLNGSICFMSWGKDFDKGKCKLLKKNMNIRAYFPDATTEVTDQLVLTLNKGNKTIEFSFKTPELSLSNQNVFTVIVGKNNKKINHLLKVKSKIDKRIKFLAKRISKKVKKGNVTKWMKYIIRKLRRTSKNIALKIDKGPDVLAKMDIPLQVGSQIAAPFYYSSFMGGYKMILSTSSGAIIEGQSIEASAEVINLTNNPMWYPKFKIKKHFKHKKILNKNHHFSMEFKYKNKKQFVSDFKNFPLGSKIQHTFTIPSIQSIDTNSLTLSLLMKKKKRRRKKRKLKIVKRAEILHELVVYEDNVSPRWKDVIPNEEIQYYQNFPVVSASITDEFGSIDKKSIHIFLDKSGIKEDVTSSSSITNINNEKEYHLELNSVLRDEGHYSLILEGKDLAGNHALPSPLVRNIFIDQTKPTLSISAVDNIFTNSTQFNFTIVADDLSPVSTTVFQNGQEILKSSLGIINISASLVEGTNSFEIKSIDAAGNLSLISKLENIHLDTSSPELLSLNISDNQFLNQLEFNVLGTTDEKLHAVIINGNQFFLNPASFSFNMPFSLTEGQQTISIELVDLAGNITNTTRNITVDTIAPVINTDLQDNFITNETQQIINIEVKDQNAVLSKVFLNDNLVGDFNSENILLDILLSEGINILKVVSTDEAGNSNTTSFVKSLTLDTTLPVLSLDVPVLNAIVNDDKVYVSGSSNEVITSVKANGLVLEISQDKKSFSGTIPVKLGKFFIKLELSDIASNIAILERSIQVNPIAPEGCLAEISFLDSEIEAEVRRQISKVTGPITYSDAVKIKSIDLSYKQITNLDGLECLIPFGFNSPKLASAF